MQSKKGPARFSETWRAVNMRYAHMQGKVPCFAVTDENDTKLILGAEHSRSVLLRFTVGTRVHKT